MRKKAKKVYICSDGSQFYDSEMCNVHLFWHPEVRCIEVKDA